MATMDIIKLNGGSPANFLDVGGGATPQAIKQAFDLITSDPKVTAIFVNIFGGIVRCDAIAQGLISVVESMNLRTPIVARLQGTNMELAAKLINESGLKIFSIEDLQSAAEKSVQFSKVVKMARDIDGKHHLVIDTVGDGSLANSLTYSWRGVQFGSIVCIASKYIQTFYSCSLAEVPRFHIFRFSTSYHTHSSTYHKRSKPNSNTFYSGWRISFEYSDPAVPKSKFPSLSSSFSGTSSLHFQAHASQRTYFPFASPHCFKPSPNALISSLFCASSP